MNVNSGFKSQTARMAMPKLMIKPGATIAARMHQGMSFLMNPNAIAAQRRQGSEAHVAASTGHLAEPKASAAAPSIKTPAVAPQALSPEEQERQRLQEISEIAPVIKDDELVSEAKYGDAQRSISPYSAQELAFKAAQKRVENLAYEDIDAAIRAAKGCAHDSEAKMAAGRRIVRTVLEADVDAGVQAVKGIASNQRARVEEGRRIAFAYANSEH